MTTATPTASAANAVKAAGWMLGAIVSFSSMAIAGRMVLDTHDTFELMFFRSLVGIVLVLTIAGAAGTLGQVTTRHMRTHGVRNLVHFTGQNLWFYALTVIPLAQVFALEFTSPIWVIVLAPILLGEPLTRLRMVVVVLGFIGILLVANPGAADFNPGILAAALSAVAFALTHITTKRLTRTETVTCILFWLTVIQAGFGFVATGYDLQITWPTMQTAPWIFLTGCAGLFAHFCVTSALRIAPAVIVVPMDFVRLPVIALIGLVFYNEPLGILMIVGSLIIIGANMINIVFEARK